MLWQTTRFQIDLSQPQVMGIVNLTPASTGAGTAEPPSDSGTGDGALPVSGGRQMAAPHQVQKCPWAIGCR